MHTFTASDGVEIAYRQWGSPDGRPPVLLHHGFVADSHINWVAPGVVDALVGAGHRVVAHDARGHFLGDGDGRPAAAAGQPSS